MSCVSWGKKQRDLILWESSLGISNNLPRYAITCKQRVLAAEMHSGLEAMNEFHRERTSASDLFGYVSACGNNRAFLWWRSRSSSPREKRESHKFEYTRSKQKRRRQNKVTYSAYSNHSHCNEEAEGEKKYLQETKRYVQEPLFSSSEIDTYPFIPIVLIEESKHYRREKSVWLCMKLRNKKTDKTMS